MKLTYKMLNGARAAMDAAFDARASRAARALKIPTREQAHRRSPDGRAQARAAAANARAVQIGRNYHRRVAPLFASARGDISYGRGGREHVEYLYARSYKFPARWLDGGARVERGMLILENHRGVEKARIKMPPARARLAPPDCLLQGDCYAVYEGKGAVRFGPAGRTGYAMRLPGVYAHHYWEHGSDAADCLAERARKVNIAQIQARMDGESARESRRLRLLARISNTVMVTRADAAATGACAAGIAAWCARVGAGDSMTARDVVRLATETGERRAILAAIFACQRASMKPQAAFILEKT